MSIDVVELQHQVTALTAQVEALSVENERIAVRLQAALHELFQRSSEKMRHSDAAQAMLFDEPENVTTAAGEPHQSVIGTHVRTRYPRKALPSDLPVEEHIIDIPQADKHCGCGTQLVQIGQEVSDKLDIIPAKLTIIRTIRPKYACRACEGSGDEERPAVRIAPLPPAVIPRGIATPGLLAYILTAKFVDHLPFARQQRIFYRLHIDLSRQRMADWAIAVGEAVEPLILQLVMELRTGPGLLVDETPMQVMKEPQRSDTAKSWMWAALGGLVEHPLVYFRYDTSRGAEAARKIIGDFAGYLQSDGAKAYEVARKPHAADSAWGDLRRVGCWAHTRRKFFEAQQTGGKASAATIGLAKIATLYRIETELKQLPRDETFRRERVKRAVPILRDLRRWLITKAGQVAPKSPLGVAVTYALGHWTVLVRYIKCPHLTPDTNRVEAQIRPFVVGRNAWMFNGSPRGARAAANIYSLVQTAKLNGIEPYHYLRTLLTKLPYAKTASDYRALLPPYIKLT